MPVLVPILLITLLWWLSACRSPGVVPMTPSTSMSSAIAPSESSATTPNSGLTTIPESQLPAEGRHTLELIRAGGPYPYDEDGGVFRNRERILPKKTKGYYHEFTVETPASADRGARRIIAGRDGDLYYTDDHYASFRQIEEGR